MATKDGGKESAEAKNYFYFFRGELTGVCGPARNWIMQQMGWGRSA